MRVLVTGGSGYLGAAIGRALARRGHTPVVFSRQGTRADTGVLTLRGDLRSRRDVDAAVRQVDAVCHAGALVGIWRRRRRDFDDVNVAGTRDVIRMPRPSHHAPRLHLVFPCAASAEKTKPLAANDTSAPRCGRWSGARRRTRRRAVVTLISGVVYGLDGTEGNRRAVVRDHLHRRLRHVGGDRQWSFAWIEDVAEAHVSALDAACRGRVRRRGRKPDRCGCSRSRGRSPVGGAAAPASRRRVWRGPLKRRRRGWAALPARDPRGRGHLPEDWPPTAGERGGPPRLPAAGARAGGAGGSGPVTLTKGLFDRSLTHDRRTTDYSLTTTGISGPGHHASGPGRRVGLQIATWMTHTDAVTVAGPRRQQQAFGRWSRTTAGLCAARASDDREPERCRGCRQRRSCGLKQIGRFESRANFGTWLHRIAVNCSIDLIDRGPSGKRIRRRRPRPARGAPVTSKAVEASPEQLMRAPKCSSGLRAMSGLSQMERAAFVRGFEGTRSTDQPGARG